LEAGKATFKDSMKLAREIEAIQNDRKRIQKIAAVKSSMPSGEAEIIFWDELAVDKIDQIAALHKKQQNFPAWNFNTTQIKIVPSPRPTATGPVTPTLSAITARKNATCNVNATLAAVREPRWSTQTAKSTSPGSTTSLRKKNATTTMTNPSTRMPRWAQLPI
jgi:hypothetical protein